MLIFFFWITWSFVNGMIAANNRRDVIGVMIASVFLSPLLAWLYLMAVGKRDIQPVLQAPPVVLPPPTEKVKTITVYVERPKSNHVYHNRTNPSDFKLIKS